MNFVFDLYGTLADIWTDEERAELWEGIALLLGDGEERAGDVRREYASLCKSAKRDESHEIDLLSVFQTMLRTRGVDPSVAGSLASEFRRLSMVRLSLFDGAYDMLKQLKDAGGGVYLLSNAQSCFTMDELSTLGLCELFDGIAISSDMGVKKPYVGAFETAFARFGISKDSSIYVGNDMRDDILGASNFGLPTLYIHTPQSGSYPELDIPEPTYRVSNHAEMTERLLLLIDR